MTNDTILVTGARGLVGSAIVRALKQKGFTDIWEASRKDVDFENKESTKWYFDECKPAYVFHCAAKVGGIADNIREPATFLESNLEIQNNVLCAAHNFAVKKLLFVASAACYPESAPTPIRPTDLMTGHFDYTKAGYAMAKLAGIALCQAMRAQFHSDFISVIPNNVYGLGDRSSHVIPDLMRRFTEAKKSGSPVVCWGTGNARREFIHADDLADACVFLMNAYSGFEPVNIGPGNDYTMRDLSMLLRTVTGFSGEVKWDLSKPEGAQRRLLDSTVLYGMGWRPRIELETGLRAVYQDLLCRPH